MKKILTYLGLTLLGTFILSYLVLFVFFQLNEQRLENLPKVHESTSYRIKAHHSIHLIDGGFESLKKRLELIESAKQSVELEFFIYDLDLAARLITEKLLEKAKSGVKVRLLVDFSQPIFKLKPLFANFLIKNGIEVRYYNTSSILNLLSVQHRNHRKFLIVDEKQVLTGGRNVAAEYFDLSEDFNFLDSDILIEGPLVTNLRKSFDLYWNSQLSEKPEPYSGSTEELDILLSTYQKDKEVLKKFESNRVPILQAKTSCEDLAFVTDFPGMQEKDRQVFKTLSTILSKARQNVLAESPYFIIKEGGLNLLNDLSSNKVKVEILTNSLQSTDAFYTTSALYLTRESLKQINLSLYAHQGKKPNAIGKWGIHSKRAVVDDSIVLFGTYNIDPRSANLNSEVIIVCYEGREFADLVSQSIRNRMKDSKPLIQSHIYDGKALFGESSLTERLKFYLSIPFVYFLDTLL